VASVERSVAWDDDDGRARRSLVDYRGFHLRRPRPLARRIAEAELARNGTFTQTVSHAWLGKTPVTPAPQETRLFSILRTPRTARGPFFRGQSNLTRGWRCCGRRSPANSENHRSSGTVPREKARAKGASLQDCRLRRRHPPSPMRYGAVCNLAGPARPRSSGLAARNPVDPGGRAARPPGFRGKCTYHPSNARPSG
jgi:hypothetical protein